MKEQKKPIHQHLAVRVFAVVLLFVLIPFVLLLKNVQNNMASIINKEVSNRVLQTFSSSSDEIEKVFGRMASISTYIINDEEFFDSLRNPAASYYDRTLIFQRILQQIYSLDLYEYEMNYEQNDLGIKIILSDNMGNLYTSWGNSRGINIDSLLDSEIVKKAAAKKGFLFWDMNAPGIALSAGSKKPQIALARSLINIFNYNVDYGFLIVTVSQQKLFSILNQYKNSEGDYIFAVLNDGTFIYDQSRYLIDVPESVLSEANTFRPVIIDGKPYLLNRYTIDKSISFSTEKLDLFCLTDYDQILEQIDRQTAQIRVLATFSAIAIGVIALWVSWAIARPVNRLTNHINKYTPGTKPVPITVKRRDEIGQIYQAYNHLSEQNYQLIEKLKEERKVHEKYYLESLKSKISPHFLFNTLNSIRWMAVMRNATNIQQSIDALASILKYSLSNDTEEVPLSQELKIVEDYCYIQETRFGCDCVLEKNISDACLEIKVIKFILQPVVENSFKHAFTSDSNNKIFIHAWIQDNKLWISISDSGKGFSEDMLCHFRSGENRTEKMNHLGLHIVDERIRLEYGEPYGLQLENTAEGGACVLYCLPVDSEESRI